MPQLQQQVIVGSVTTKRCTVAMTTDGNILIIASIIYVLIYWLLSWSRLGYCAPADSCMRIGHRRGTCYRIITGIVATTTS